MLRIGAHVDQQDPLAEARVRRADLVQVFFGDPQGWKAPHAPAGAEQLAPAGIDLYVHAPYVINVATTNNRIRIPSRKLLSAHAAAAAAAGANALIVHGGHVGKTDERAEGFANWAKAFDRAEFSLPILIENTAGGDRAMTRRLDQLARLWDALDNADVGFCLDTCHAHAGGEELTGLVDRVKAITGRIDLVHANGSKDSFDSGRDRHENLTTGQIDPQTIVEIVAAAGAPVVCETPGGAEGQGADIVYLRAHLPT